MATAVAYRSAPPRRSTLTASALVGAGEADTPAVPRGRAAPDPDEVLITTVLMTTVLMTTVLITTSEIALVPPRATKRFGRRRWISVTTGVVTPVGVVSNTGPSVNDPAAIASLGRRPLARYTVDAPSGNARADTSADVWYRSAPAIRSAETGAGVGSIAGRGGPNSAPTASSGSRLTPARTRPDPCHLVEFHSDSTSVARFMSLDNTLGRGAGIRVPGSGDAGSRAPAW